MTKLNKWEANLAAVLGEACVELEPREYLRLCAWVADTCRRELECARRVGVTVEPTEDAADVAAREKCRYKCPHCGWEYRPADAKWATQRPWEAVPTHDFPELCRAVCPGSEQHPRNAASDHRPLWKDLPPEGVA